MTFRVRNSARPLLCFMLFWAASVAVAHEGHHGPDDDHGPHRSLFTTRPNPKLLPMPKQEGVFQFIVYGDRTGGVPAGLRVLEQAVRDTNLLDPDLVLTVGDLIQGYNQTPEWMTEMREYRDVMDRLNMRWFPVAGNHDVYWRGPTPPPPGHHESNYEKHFGPLWYTFAHKNAGFIVLYSDEGDPSTNQKAFNVPTLQRMSDQQLAFLDQALNQHKERDHVFVFLHHPRWIGGGYAGGNWDVVEQKLLDAGNVSGVFAGHIHRMRFDEAKAKDGERTLPYYTLATTGGHLSAKIPAAGYLHHFNVVTVRPSGVEVASIPVGAVMDPKYFTPDFIADTDLARSIHAQFAEAEEQSVVAISLDGSASGETQATIRNPCQRPIDVTVSLAAANTDWRSSLDHQHFQLPSGDSRRIRFQMTRPPGDLNSLSIPQIQVDVEYLGENARIAMPSVRSDVPLSLPAVSSEFFQGLPNRCVSADGGAVIIDHDQFDLPDGPFTLEAWVNPSSTSGYAGMVAKTQNSEYAFFFDEGVPQFDVHLDGQYVTAKSKTVMPANRWTHLAGVFDGSQVQLFVQGKLVEAVAGSGTRGQNRLPLLIGADPDRSGRPTRPFEGLIDEVRLSRGVIYTGAFEPSTRLKSTADTVLMMNLDRQIGPFLIDQSQSGAHARLSEGVQLIPRQDN